MSQHLQLSAILVEIQGEMVELDIWQSEMPTEEALASTEPFCVDTLAFHEWVQWIMLPRLNHMAENKLPLPNNSDMFSMAEEAFKNLEVKTDTLLSLILQLDNCLRTSH